MVATGINPRDLTVEEAQRETIFLREREKGGSKHSSSSSSSSSEEKERGVEEEGRRRRRARKGEKRTTKQTIANSNKKRGGAGVDTTDTTAIVIDPDLDVFTEAARMTERTFDHTLIYLFNCLICLLWGVYIPSSFSHPICMNLIMLICFPTHL